MWYSFFMYHVILFIVCIDLPELGFAFKDYASH